MISVILTDSPIVRDAIVGELRLSRETHIDHPHATVYRRHEWILCFAPIHQTTIEWIVENFLPDRVSIPLLGRSISPEHRIGDVILPNVFFTYSPAIEGVEISGENRDHLIGEAIFLETYEEQGDFLEEHYGVSIGGILLQHTPVDLTDEMITHLGLVYESDVMIGEKITDMVDLTTTEGIAPISLLVGVVEGKLSDIPHSETAVTFTIHNLVKTIRSLREE